MKKTIIKKSRDTVPLNVYKFGFWSIYAIHNDKREGIGMLIFYFSSKEEQTWSNIHINCRKN
jgi:hypothetical protein